MESIVSIKPLLAVLSSLVAVPLILKTGDERRNVREFWSVLAGVIKFSIVISMVPTILAGHTIEYTLVTFYQGIDIKFRVDPLGILFATVSSFLWIITTFYSIGYMRTNKEKSQTRYFTCFAISLSSTIAVAFSANLITLFVFYEFLSLATVPLVGHKETPEALEGAKKYFLYLLSLSKTLLLSGIFIVYMVAGTTDFQAYGLLRNETGSTLLFIGFFLFLFGFAKGAVMPVHNWLPSAMVAPTPVSALLHAVAVVKVGVFSILRVVFHIYGVDLMTRMNLGITAAYVVSFTIVAASIIALSKDNIKARLAYSTVSQLSYVILGAVLLTSSSMMGGVMHIANHAFSKITLFFCAGSLYVAAHKTEVSQLSGIGKKMPWTMAAFFIGSLSMIGVPPAAGFTSKWYLALGSIEAHQVPILMVLLASTVLNAAYFLPITYKAFFEKEEAVAGGDHGHHGHDHHEEVREIPMVAIPLVVTAIISLLIGIYPDYLMTLAQEVIR
ncbi:MAG: monovalent cation/H+ antiporter subunit D family protein [Syntrophobacteraceae bacterium]|nr:monovalent cation/H+ antiporter subunit D family protein [Syntrophobacteraceae bacterium]